MSAEWPTRRLKHLVRLVADKATPSTIDKPYIGLEAIKSWTGEIDPNMSEETGESIGNRFRPGDVLFGKLRPYLAKVAAPGFEGHCSGEALVLRPSSRIQTQFLRYRLVEQGAIDAVNASTYGAKMPRASWDFIGNLQFNVPDLTTQKAISDFLDRETARIDTMIEKKHRLVTLLEEKRSTLITASVTGEIDPVTGRHRPLNGVNSIDSMQIDTRLQWFGSVPPDWKIARNKNAFRIISKAVGDKFADFDLLSLTLQGVKLRDMDSGKGKFPASFETYQEVSPGDIVFCLFDIDETPRTVGLSHHKGMITGAYTVVRCSDLADPRFVTYFYISIDQRKGLRPFYTGLRKVVRPDTFLNATFPIPDLATQKAIADFLDRETTNLERLKKKTAQSIDCLGEFRTALITAAVTGQIDVTSWGKQGQTDRRLDDIQEAMGA